eukprot:6382866-Pyramimonas_sp.AAC.1
MMVLTAVGEAEGAGGGWEPLGSADMHLIYYRTLYDNAKIENPSQRCPAMANHFALVFEPPQGFVGLSRASSCGQRRHSEH